MEKEKKSTNINWFPGHMAKTRKQITEDLKLVDVVIEILDARIPISSQNPEIQKIIQNKKKVIVLNKSDLSDENENRKWMEYFIKQGNRAVLVDSNTGKGINDVIKQIQLTMADEMKKLSEKAFIISSASFVIILKTPVCAVYNCRTIVNNLRGMSFLFNKPL